MGRKNIDRIPVTEWSKTAATVMRMSRLGWQVISRCQACDLVMDVDLERMAHDLGPDFSLWNRHPPCRNRRCRGRVVFQARAPGKLLFEALVTPPEAG